MFRKRLMKNERPTFPKKAVVTAGMPYSNKNLHFGHVGGMFVHADIFARYFLRKNTNTRKYQMETVGEFLKKPMLYVPKKYVEEAQELAERLPEHSRIDEEKNSFLFEFQTLDHRDKAKAVLDEQARRRTWRNGGGTMRRRSISSSGEYWCIQSRRRAARSSEST